MRRVVAMVAVILLISMFIATLVFAVLQFPGSDRLFMGFLGMDILLPVLIWMYLYLLKRAEKTDLEQFEASKKEMEEKNKGDSEDK